MGSADTSGQFPWFCQPRSFQENIVYDCEFDCSKWLSTTGLVPLLWTAVLPSGEERFCLHGPILIWYPVACHLLLQVGLSVSAVVEVPIKTHFCFLVQGQVRLGCIASIYWHTGKSQTWEQCPRVSDLPRFLLLLGLAEHYSGMLPLSTDPLATNVQKGPSACFLKVTSVSMDRQAFGSDEGKQTLICITSSPSPYLFLIHIYRSSASDTCLTFLLSAYLHSIHDPANCLLNGIFDPWHINYSDGLVTPHRSSRGENKIHSHMLPERPWGSPCCLPRPGNHLVHQTSPCPVLPPQVSVKVFILPGSKGIGCLWAVIKNLKNVFQFYKKKLLIVYILDKYCGTIIKRR